MTVKCRWQNFHLTAYLRLYFTALALPSVEVTRATALDRFSQILSSRGAQTTEVEATSFRLYDPVYPSVVQRHRRRRPSTMRVGDANRQSGGRVPHLF